MEQNYRSRSRSPLSVPKPKDPRIRARLEREMKSNRQLVDPKSEMTMFTLEQVDRRLQKPEPLKDSIKTVAPVLNVQIKDEQQEVFDNPETPIIARNIKQEPMELTEDDVRIVRQKKPTKKEFAKQTVVVKQELKDEDYIEETHMKRTIGKTSEPNSRNARQFDRSQGFPLDANSTYNERYEFYPSASPMPYHQLPHFDKPRLSFFDGQGNSFISGEHLQSVKPQPGSMYKSSSPTRSQTSSVSESNLSKSPDLVVPRMTRDEIELLDFSWTEDDTEKECPLCKITCTGQTPWEEHLKGKKHKWYRAKALGKNPKPLEKPQCFYAKHRTRYSPSAFDYKDRPVLTEAVIDGRLTKVYRCEVCDMNATDIEIYKQHIDGRKHKRMLVEDKHTAKNALIDMCVGCYENLNKICAACNNMIWWGQCGHAFHQCCAKSTLKGPSPLCPACDEERTWIREKRTRAIISE